MNVDWKAIEAAWLAAVTEAIVAIATAHPAETLEAGAFYMLYGDGGSIGVPAFGLNAVGGDEGVRWAPPDWRWSMANDAHAKVRAAYEPLAALDVSDAAFAKLWKQHGAMLVRVAKRATARVQNRRIGTPARSFAKTFFVGILDLAQDDGIQLLKRSVDAKLLKAAGTLDALEGKRKPARKRPVTSAPRPPTTLPPMPEGRTVYRLHQDPAAHGTVSLDRPSLKRIFDGWRKPGRATVALRATSSADRPTGDFPGLAATVLPMLSARVVEQFRDFLESAGSLLPFQHKGRTYYVYDVGTVVDCLDAKRSSPMDDLGDIELPVFLTKKVPAGVPAFRTPHTGRYVFWTDVAVARFRAFALAGVQYWPLWSADPKVRIRPGAM